MRNHERIQAPVPGRRLWLCRGGFERYLHEELMREKLNPRTLSDGAVECDDSTFIPVFGRCSFRVTAELEPKGTVEVWAVDGRAVQGIEAPPRETGPARLVLCAYGEGAVVSGGHPIGAPQRLRW